MKDLSLSLRIKVCEAETETLGNKKSFLDIIKQE